MSNRDLPESPIEGRNDLASPALGVGSNPAGMLATDNGCICKGNWRAIVNECRPLLGKMFTSHDGKDFRFFGIVDGEDDYYYSIEGHGYSPDQEAGDADR
jgi:hypothetical protein